MQKAITKQPSADTMLRFISGYRKLEKQPLSVGYDLIRSIPGLSPSLADHLCGHWRGKRRGFGAFYLNLSYEYRYFFLKEFGVDLPEDKQFVDDHIADPRGTIFDEPAGFLYWANKLLVFFENHGIVEVPAAGVRLYVLPKPNKSFGNSSNWADYLLSGGLSAGKVIDSILIL